MNVEIDCGLYIWIHCKRKIRNVLILALLKLIPQYCYWIQVLYGRCSSKDYQSEFETLNFSVLVLSD